MKLGAMALIASCTVHPIDPKPRADMSTKAYGTDIRYPTRRAFDSGGAIGFIDREGRVVIPPILKGTSGTFDEGLLAFTDQTSKLRGYLNVDGHVVISPRFVDAGPFSEGLALASLPGQVDPTGKWPIDGYIDRQGEFVIPPQFRAGSPFSEGLARVIGCDGVYGFVNPAGELLELPQYTNAGNFAGGLAMVTADFKRHGAINALGEEVIAPQYERARGDFAEGLWLVERDDVWLFVDTEGRQAFPETFEDAQPFHEGRAAVEFGGKWGYIDRSGALVIEPRFDDPKSFYEGLACPGIAKSKVRDSGDWYGVIDLDGNGVLPFEYDSIGGFTDGLSGAKKDGVHGTIDRTGRWIFVDPPVAR